MVSPWTLATGLFLFAVALGDLLLCPHSKVEESFQLQATHDLFYFGVGPAWRNSILGKNTTLPYDHLQFPGVVPRTFLGPLILSSLCQVVRFLSFPILDIASRPLLVQFLARFFLMTLNFSGWMRLAFAADRYGGHKGKNLGAWLLLTSTCQFHIPFYASRMLPNTFALAIILHAYSFWIEGQIEWAASCIVFATAIFRCDILILLASVGLSWLISGQLTVRRALRVGVLTGMFGLLATVPVDSLLWQRPVWPEGEVFYFNTILGKSSDWGTSPWHWYFTSALPKSMLLTLILVPLSFLRIPEILEGWERRQQESKSGHKTNKFAEPFVSTDFLHILLPIVGFIGIYSSLGHKEIRFIFPALPVLNLVAASTLARLAQLAFPPKGKAPTFIGRIGFACGILCLLSTLMGNVAFVAVSRWNYPGGQALTRLIEHVQKTVGGSEVRHVYVHADVASAMSGVSLFGQRAAEVSSQGSDWTFDKGGYEDEHSLQGNYELYTHLLSESMSPSIDFAVIDVIPGRPRLNRRARVETEPSIYILERRDSEKS